MPVLKNAFRRMVRGYQLLNFGRLEEIPSFQPVRMPIMRPLPPRPIQINIRTEEKPKLTTEVKAEETEIRHTESQKVPIVFQPQVQPIRPIRIPVQTVPLYVQQEPRAPEREDLISKEGYEGLREGLGIPRFVPENVRIGRVTSTPSQKKIAMTYPLIPKTPLRGEKILASATIYWDEKANRYFYSVTEPEMTEYIKEVMNTVKELLEQRLDIEFSRLRKNEAKDYLRSQIREIISQYGIKLTEQEKESLQYYMERDFIGLGKIEPFIQDANIEDISCDGLNIPIFIFHRNPTIGSVVSNIEYNDKDELDSFIIKLAQVSGKSISVAQPLLSGSLPDGSRVQATLSTDIARRGSNFTIRKFTDEPLTPIHLLQYGTLDVKTLAYLWMAVDFGKSVLVSGGTASGKTTLLNVLSLFIRPEKKIVSIEDTPELKLPHPHWVPHVARTAVAVEGERKIGDVDLFDLLKESLRQRPDYIIVGEVRGKEAYVLFQEMATGHPSLATIHAENSAKLIDRLTTPPISLPPSLIASVDVIAFLVSTRYREKQVRRVNEVVEVLGFDQKKNFPITNRVFKWNPMNDNFDAINNSVVLRNISVSFGMKPEEISDELQRRMLVLYWMLKKNVVEYKDVHKVVNLYYNFPERVITSIMGGG